VSGKGRAMTGPITSLRNKRKLERLSLIKDRYRELILEPRERIEMELDEDITEEYLDDELAHDAEGVFAHVHEDEDDF